MRAVVQRVREAAVTVAGAETGRVGYGLLVFLGVEGRDTPEDAAWLARKVVQVRVFPDAEGLMNKAVTDVAGGVLVVSQFTLFGNLRKGTRPSFNRAAHPDRAVPLYQAFIQAVEGGLGRSVPAGVFGAEMEVYALNDGPVTLLIDSQDKRL